MAESRMQHRPGRSNEEYEMKATKDTREKKPKLTLKEYAAQCAKRTVRSCVRIALIGHRNDAKKLRNFLISQGYYPDKQAKDNYQEIGERIMLHKIVDHLTRGDLHALFCVAGMLHWAPMGPELYDRYCMTEEEVVRQARRFYKDVPSPFQKFILSELDMDGLGDSDEPDEPAQAQEA